LYLFDEMTLLADKVPPSDRPRFYSQISELLGPARAAVVSGFTRSASFLSQSPRTVENIELAPVTSVTLRRQELVMRTALVRLSQPDNAPHLLFFWELLKSSPGMLGALLQFLQKRSKATDNTQDVVHKTFGEISFVARLSEQSLRQRVYDALSVKFAYDARCTGCAEHCLALLTQYEAMSVLRFDRDGGAVHVEPAWAYEPRLAEDPMDPFPLRPYFGKLQRLSSELASFAFAGARTADAASGTQAEPTNGAANAPAGRERLISNFFEDATADGVKAQRQLRCRFLALVGAAEQSPGPTARVTQLCCELDSWLGEPVLTAGTPPTRVRFSVEAFEDVEFMGSYPCRGQGGRNNEEQQRLSDAIGATGRMLRPKRDASGKASNPLVDIVFHENAVDEDNEQCVRTVQQVRHTGEEECQRGE